LYELYSGQNGREPSEDSCSLLRLVSNAVSLALLCHSFLYLASAFEEVAIFSQQIINDVQVLITKLSEILPEQETLEMLLVLNRLLEKEVGVQRNAPRETTVLTRMLVRLNELCGLHRVCFLLS